jgi:hypothetical protein
VGKYISIEESNNFVLVPLRLCFFPASFLMEPFKIGSAPKISSFYPDCHTKQPSCTKGIFFVVVVVVVVSQ